MYKYDYNLYYLLLLNKNKENTDRIEDFGFLINNLSCCEVVYFIFY